MKQLFPPFDGYTSFCRILIFLLLVFVCIPTAGYGQSQADSLWSYETIRTDSNRDGTLDYLDEEVTISGVANIASGLLHEHYLQAFVQNDSAGMSIFAMEIDASFEPGDSLVVRGKVQRYNGLAEVFADSYEVYKKEGDEPRSQSLLGAMYNPREYLGMLVEGKGIIVEKGSTYNGKYVLIAPSDPPEVTLMVYVSNFHKNFQEFDFDVLSVGDEISVKGIITEYNPDFPEERTYKLFLRTADDLQYSSMPRYYMLLGAGGLLIGIVLVGGWIVMLRRRVDKKTKELQQSLDEKEVLLREIHHRVKNNLSIISGLIGLQMDTTDDKQAQNVLDDSQTRIRSMALIHDKLYQTNSLSNIRLDEYVKELVGAIHDTSVQFSDSVELKFHTDEAKLDIDKVVPCGLLINEVVVNAFKHAFSRSREGILEIHLRKYNGKVKLTIADNGPGLPEDFSISESDSLGSSLIQTFVQQLEAEMEIESQQESGTAFTFIFSVN